MENPGSALEKLSPEQIAALNDEQKAIFCSMTATDQAFFASSFKPESLPGVLEKKGELMKRNQADTVRLENLRETLASQAQGSSPGEEKMEDILEGAAAALGIGAGAALAVTDNSAHYQGVTPQALIDPLRVEFNNEHTRFSYSGAPQALSATVSLVTDNQSLVPAMTITLTQIEHGIDIKVNELTTQGILETMKSGGKHLLELAEQGLRFLNRSRRGLSPADLISSADQAMDSGASLVSEISNLKLKERAWKIIRQTAEPIEEQYQAEKAAEDQRRLALEKAWDNYYNCPTCGVAFGAEENQCRVCGTARPEAPAKPDPRAPSASG